MGKLVQESPGTPYTDTFPIRRERFCNLVCYRHYHCTGKLCQAHQQSSSGAAAVVTHNLLRKGRGQARTYISRSSAALSMETMQLLLIAAAVAAACGALFVAWAATSDSREARVYRRKWKEFRLKNSKRNTSKYRGVGAGGGIYAASGERGLRSTCETPPPYAVDAAPRAGASARDKRVG